MSLTAFDVWEEPKAGASNGASVRGIAMPKDASIIVRSSNARERRRTPLGDNVLVGVSWGKLLLERDSTSLKCY
jgi:hypothetical protein